MAVQSGEKSATGRGTTRVDGLARHRENSAVPRKRIANGPSLGHTREQRN